MPENTPAQKLMIRLPAQGQIGMEDTVGKKTVTMFCKFDLWTIYLG